MPAATVPASGLLRTRQLWKAEFKYIKVVDDTDALVAKIQIGAGDARGTWSDDEAANPLTAKLVLKGSDTEVGVGKKIAKAYLENVDGSAQLIAKIYDTVFTFGTVDDTYTIELGESIS